MKKSIKTFYWLLLEMDKRKPLQGENGKKSIFEIHQIHVGSHYRRIT